VGPVRLLLDTHALIWWLLDDPKLPARARSLIADGEVPAFVSSASAWEILTKRRKGRLPEFGEIAESLEGYVQRSRFETLAITFAHAAAAGRLPGPHNDPFDRMLIAQAAAERLTVVTVDPVFENYGVETVWG
jgi:PIN domain nuclease of toxin-antitoxin system